MRLRVLLFLVAVLAIVLGASLALQRRSMRLTRSALAYGRANQLENRLEKVPAVEVQPLLDRVHWNDAVSEAYRQAASRPWIFQEPNPDTIVCRCSYHESRNAIPAVR